MSAGDPEVAGWVVLPEHGRESRCGCRPRRTWKASKSRPARSPVACAGRRAGGRRRRAAAGWRRARPLAAAVSGQHRERRPGRGGRSRRRPGRRGRCSTAGPAPAATAERTAVLVESSSSGVASGPCPASARSRKVRVPEVGSRCTRRVAARSAASTTVRRRAHGWPGGATRTSRSRATTCSWQAVGQVGSLDEADVGVAREHALPPPAHCSWRSGSPPCRGASRRA